jgi:hypothetical protein
MALHKDINNKIHDDRSFYTYLHCLPDGTPFYVGKGIGIRAFKLSKHDRSTYHQRIVNKYGRENINVFIFSCESEDQAFSDEIQQIAQLKKEGHVLVNFTNGGDSAPSQLGVKRSAQSRMKMSLAHIGKKLKPRSAEWCKNIATAKLGNRYGVGKRSDEFKANLSAKAKGRIPSEDTRKAMSIAAKKRYAKVRENAITKGVL